MQNKPNRYAEWATNEVFDPITGESNRYEPPQAKKDAGWVRHEAPSRQWVNNQYNLIDGWIKSLDTTSVADKNALPVASTNNIGVTVHMLNNGEIAISNGVAWLKVLTGTLT